VTLEEGYFDRMYAASADPWGFEERWYEQRKYALTLAALPRPTYRRAFEAGCSVGVLTALLADRCGELLAADVSAAAVETARARTAHLPQVTVEHRHLPGQWPAGTFDLLVLSEICYYFDRADLTVLLDRAVSALDPDGHLVAVHWRHPVDDYPLGGDEVHDALAARPDLTRTARHVEDDFRLEVFSPAPRALSVAQETGLV
jgi:SAM-dependent methyltransferase